MQKMRNEQIKEVLKDLSSREQIIIRMYYGLDGEEMRSFADIAEAIGMDRSHPDRVKEHWARALRKLRCPWRVKKLDGFLD